MCELTTMLALAGAVSGAAGAMQTAQAQKSAASYQAQVSANNAKVAGWQAESADARGQDDAMAVGRKQADVRGKQAASMAANGLDLSSGSPAAVLEQTDYYGLADQKTAVQNASDTAWGLRTKGDSYTAESNMQKSKADGINPLMSGATSLLGSAGNVADKWSTQNPGKSFFDSWGSDNSYETKYARGQGR